jgi:hypothetical protein
MGVHASGSDVVNSLSLLNKKIERKGERRRSRESPQTYHEEYYQRKGTLRYSGTTGGGVLYWNTTLNIQNMFKCTSQQPCQREKGKHQ